MSRDDGDAVFKALANPVRRTLLDHLKHGPRTTGDLAAATPHLSRYAVMQHLEVLTGAGLVLARREGRHRYNHLNAVPLRQAYDRWVGALAGGLATQATALHRHVHQPEPQGATVSSPAEKPARVVRIENEIAFEAPRARVFRALTKEQHEWYPYNYGGERVRSIVWEPRVGGQCFEDWGDGLGTLYGTVWYYDPPVATCLRGHLRGGVSLEHWYEFEETDGGAGCVLKQSLTAFGPLDDDDAAGIRTHGDLATVADRLRAHVAR